MSRKGIYRSNIWEVCMFQISFRYAGQSLSQVGWDYRKGRCIFDEFWSAATHYRTPKIVISIKAVAYWLTADCA